MAQAILAQAILAQDPWLRGPKGQNRKLIRAACLAAMDRSRTKLVNCVGHAVRTAKKCEVPTEARHLLQSALRLLLDAECSKTCRSPIRLSCVRLPIKLYDALELSIQDSSDAGRRVPHASSSAHLSENVASHDDGACKEVRQVVATHFVGSEGSGDLVSETLQASAEAEETRWIIVLQLVAGITLGQSSGSPGGRGI